MWDILIGFGAGFVSGAAASYLYSNRVVEELEMAKAKVELELTKVKAAAAAVKSDVEKV